MAFRPVNALPSLARRHYSTRPPPPIAVAWFTKVGVLGAGLMGHGIAQTAAMYGFNVTMVDVKQEYLDNAMKSMTNMYKQVFAFQVKKGKMKPAAAEKTLKDSLSRITMTTDLNAVKDCEIVIESVVENMDIKRDLYDKLDKILDKETILGTNTSSYSITELGKMSRRADRFAGVHFFNPVMVLPLVEIIKTPDTTDRTFNAFARLAKMMMKKGVKCQDTPGFIVNRLLVPYLSQACLMADRGDATFRDIDKAMRLGAGMPQGPHQLADFVGLDTCQAILSGWIQKYPQEKIFIMPKSLEEKVKQGHLGRKSGQGFYKWANDKPVDL
jgi:3-hydroxyacyl-CoA dehydrogenase